MKIFAGRSSLIGDTVMALPLIKVLQRLYDKPDITWPIAKKCRQAAPLYIDQLGINSIYITQEDEFLNNQEQKWIKENFDLFINPTPGHPKGEEWYNERSCVSETMLMAGEQYYEKWLELDEEDKKPRLNPWWNNGEKFEKTIAIFPFCGYGKGFERSPSKNWWQNLIKILIEDLDYQILHFGYYNEPDLWYGKSWELEDEPKYIYNCHFPLFEQIQKAYKCSKSITLDSGTGWIMGALGVNQISLICNWLPNHNKNFFALNPINYNNTIKTLFGEKSCDNINKEDIIKLL